MRKIFQRLVFIAITGFLLVGCGDDEETPIHTGINSLIYYGQGDCMPEIRMDKKYNKYSGKVYIVRKKDYDNLININLNCNCIVNDKIDSLKRESISLNIKNGRLKIALKPDSFLIFIGSEYSDLNNNVVYIKKDSIETRNFYFFKCTSY
jgi:hypothetical protein